MSSTPPIPSARPSRLALALVAAGCLVVPLAATTGAYALRDALAHSPAFSPWLVGAPLGSARLAQTTGQLARQAAPVRTLVANTEVVLK